MSAWRTASVDVNELSMLLHSLGLEPLSSDEIAYILSLNQL